MYSPQPQVLRLEIRPAEGGDDALGFAHELFNAFRAYLSKNDVPYSYEITRTLVISIKGDVSRLRLDRFVGTHRIQRIPKNDSTSRRHTSTATIALIEDNVTTCHISDADIRIDTYRGHGKGGQHRNKTSSAVRLTHMPSSTVITVERGRSQAQNIALAKAELTRRLSRAHASSALASVSKTRRSQITSGERPTKQWTWNQQRDEVIHHDSLARYQMSAMLKGQLDL